LLLSLIEVGSRLFWRFSCGTKLSS
jgi:hypothetical protein